MPEGPLFNYLVGETADNQESVFRRAAHLNGLCQGCLFAVTGGQVTGYSGAEEWVSELTNWHKIGRGQITVIPLQGPLNTYTEMKALAEYAKECEWKQVVITAAPFHQLRSFLTLLGAMRRLNMWIEQLRVYNLPGAPLPWQENALHSQGVLRGTREELISTELQRIRVYTDQGDLVTADEALNYLRQRDSA